MVTQESESLRYIRYRYDVQLLLYLVYSILKGYPLNMYRLKDLCQI